MIIGDDFIWLHFPKTAGTSVERAIKALRPDASADPIDHSRPWWHDTIAQRQERDASFDPSGKRVIACIRQLPSWVLSRVHFEISRSPDVKITRDEMAIGLVTEQSGYKQMADDYMAAYNSPEVDVWIRAECLVRDLSEALGVDPQVVSDALPHANKSKIDYVKDPAFWWTPAELAELYRRNPQWADVERRVYGSEVSFM